MISLITLSLEKEIVVWKNVWKKKNEYGQLSNPYSKAQDSGFDKQKHTWFEKLDRTIPAP